MKEVFIAGPPVFGDFFYNRDELINSMTATFGNNYALVGIRRVGKTSLLYKLGEVFEKKKVVSIRISVNEISPLTVENFLQKYSLEVTKAFTKDVELVEKISGFFRGKKEGFADFIKNVKITVSVKNMTTIWFEHSIKENKDYTELIEKTLLYPEKLAKEQGKKCLVFLDEFQELEKLQNNFLNALRENMQKTKNVKYIISGSAVGLMQQILGRKKSPFYGFFLSKRISGIDEKSARTLLNRTKKAKITLEKKVVDEVIKRTKCLPLYLQAFGETAIKKAFLEKKSKITEKEFDDCWNNLFEELFFHFEYLENGLRGKKREIMKCIAVDNADSVGGIAKNTGISLADIGTYLRRLVEDGFLKRKESQYEFIDPVFKEWITRRYGLGL